MGLTDHRKTLIIETATLSPEDCTAAFKAVFSTRASAGVNVGWDLKTVENGVAATYAGKKNQVLTAMSDTAGALDRAAIGSVVMFEAQPSSAGQGAECRIWLDSWKQGGCLQLFMTAQGPTMGTYMSRAANKIKELDTPAADGRHAQITKASD
jgi:hypothetical protein